MLDITGILGLVIDVGFKIFGIKNKKDNYKVYLDSTFWCKRYKIIAVHKYEKSDDVSGYTHLGQNSRRDQWSKLISIKDSRLNLKHKITPKKKKDILDVIISINGSDRHNIISFNK